MKSSYRSLSYASPDPWLEWCSCRVVGPCLTATTAGLDYAMIAELCIHRLSQEARDLDKLISAPVVLEL